MNDRKNVVMIALQLALLGEVSSKLRAVTARYDDQSIHFDCYFDGEIDEEDTESMSIVETELLAQFPESHCITHRVIRHDYPQRIPYDGVCVYARRERDFE